MDHRDKDLTSLSQIFLSCGRGHGVGGCGVPSPITLSMCLTSTLSMCLTSTLRERVYKQEMSQAVFGGAEMNGFLERQNG